MLTNLTFFTSHYIWMHIVVSMFTVSYFLTLYLFWAYLAAMAMLLKKQNPMASVHSAWCPGGLEIHSKISSDSENNSIQHVWKNEFVSKYNFTEIICLILILLLQQYVEYKIHVLSVLKLVHIPHNCNSILAL